MSKQITTLEDEEVVGFDCDFFSTFLDFLDEVSSACPNKKAKRIKCNQTLLETPLISTTNIIRANDSELWETVESYITC